MDNENKQIEEIAMRCVRICEEKKAADIVLFDKSKDSILADYFLVCCGTSMQHIRALADNLRRTLLEQGVRPRGQEGGSSQWLVLDYGIIIVHIMTPEMRRHYCLEELWDKNLIVYQGGEELPPPSQDNQAAWDNEEPFDSEDEDFEDNYEDDDFEDDYDDDYDEEDEDFDEEDEDFEDDYDDDMEIIDVDELEEEEEDENSKDKDKDKGKGPEKGGYTLKDLFGNDDK